MRVPAVLGLEIEMDANAMLVLGIKSGSSVDVSALNCYAYLSKPHWITFKHTWYYPDEKTQLSSNKMSVKLLI